MKQIPNVSPPQWIRDAWHRDPDKGDVLFLTPEEWKTTSKDELGPCQANAHLRMHGIEDSQCYASGYQRGAQVLAEFAVAHASDEFLIYPILFLYRHTVELCLKRFIPAAADLVDLPLLEDEARLLTEKATHRLDQLWAIFKPRLEGMRKNKQYMTEDQLAGIESYIRQLSDVDPQSFAFRYPASKDGKPTLPEFRHINVKRITELLDPFVALLAGLDEDIHERNQAKCEWLREAEQQALSEGVYDYG